jgi:hypothetical protein
MNAPLKALRNLGIVASFSTLGYGAYIYGVRFGNMDPFAKYRGTTLDMQTGIELGRVNLRVYHKGKLTVEANVSRVTVSQDRSTFELATLSDGVYRGNTPIHFASARGAWNVDSDQLRLIGLTRVAGKDFDIQTQDALIGRTNQTLTLPGEVHGTFMGGHVSAARLEYSGVTGDASAHLIHWQGKPPEKQVEQVAKETGQEPIVSRSWDIDADYSQKKGNKNIYTNAKATDGEVLIYAPKVEWERDTDIITATGHVSYFSGKADIVADKVVVYRKDKKAYFTGSVTMLVKSKKDQDKPPAKEPVPEIGKESFDEQFKVPGKPTVISPEDKKKIDDLRSGKNLHDYPLHLQAQEITYWYEKGSRHAIFSGSPVAKQDFPSGQWRMGFSYDGKYDGEKDLLDLGSATSHRDVRYKNSAGDMAQAGKAQFSTKDEATEDDEDLQLWDMSGIFRDTSGEDTRADKNGEPKAGDTKPPEAKAGDPKPTDPNAPSKTSPPTGPANPTTPG